MESDVFGKTEQLPNLVKKLKFMAVLRLPRFLSGVDSVAEATGAVVEGTQRYGLVVTGALTLADAGTRMVDFRWSAGETQVHTNDTAELCDKTEMSSLICRHC